MTWVESKHQYEEPSIVIGRRGGAGEPYHMFSNDPSKDAFAVSSVFDKQGNPVVAWSEGRSEAETPSSSGQVAAADFYQVALDYLQQAYYSRYPRREQDYSDTMTYITRGDGTTWQSVGTPLEGHHPILVLDEQDVPYLGYIRTTADQSEAVVVYWDGQTWKQMGDAVSNTLLDEYRNLSLVLDDNGMPVVALVSVNENGRFDLIVKKWDGSSWQRLGEDSIVVAGYNPLDVSLDYRDGKLVVATIEAKPRTFDFDPPQTLFVKEWNGESWQLLSDRPVSLDAACPVIKLDTQSNPYVAWSEIVGDGRIHLSTSVKFSHFVRE